jgi:glycosyltransferase involved in cell wall biosynthesis
LPVPPLISVLLPVHNREGSTAHAIESVLAQVYPHVELIVIDDGSTDGTPAVLARCAGRVVTLRQERRGAYAARNLGLRHARGDLIAFIDSDDGWYADRLIRQVPLLGDSEVGLVFGDAVLTDHRGSAPRRVRPTAFRITPPRRGWVTAHFAYGNFVPTSSVLVRRRCLDELGGFPETPPLSGDYLTWFRISLRHRFDYVSDPVFEYGISRDSLSRDLEASLRARIGLFSRLLAQTTDPRTVDELRRLLFHLRLSLAVARLRQGSVDALREVGRGRRHDLNGVSHRRQARWFLEYLGNQLRVRWGRWRATPGRG